MRMIPPDKDVTYKRYIPEELNQWTMSEADRKFKPGFFEQYKEFFSRTNGEATHNGARIIDASDAINLALAALEDE